MTLPKYQTFWSRFAAGLIDGLILGIVNAFFGVIIRLYVTDTDILMATFGIVAYTVYVVIGHGKSGQTVGKAIMNIKVLDVNEQRVIGYARAFVRESIYFGINLLAIICLVINKNSDSEQVQEWNSVSDTVISIASTCWFFLELISMLFSEKRRALHDLMAGSVVVQVKELEKEALNNNFPELV